MVPTTARTTATKARTDDGADGAEADEGGDGGMELVAGELPDDVHPPSATAANTAAAPSTCAEVT